MKKLLFSPFNWASSIVVSKILKPYIKGFDEKQIEIGFWDGSICLNDIELQPDFFLLFDLNFEILLSRIQEIKITIPWKAIQTQPVKLEISGVNIVISLSLIHISEPTRLGMISYAVFCLKKKKKSSSRLQNQEPTCNQLTS
eukprot:TRINITY_DN13295_c0_g1_i3.p2 TRINITY_DN13295_c0_g1~~TRINITY_DN13295_c0_g1_i3.p2  ORF type:complete len:142 (-),score=23.95 TRINITY_DN13295_c0_g1_i3:60-485(-)